jgi:TolB protein
MTGIRCGAIGVLLVLSACGGETASKVPVARFLSPENVNHIASRFSPDGSRVGYWTPGENGWDLIIARGDLGSPRTVSAGNIQTWGIVWSPDNKQLAFGSSAGASTDIMVVSADSGEARHLTTAGGTEVPVFWHPRGDRMTYIATGQGGTIRGYFLDLASGQTTAIPGNPLNNIAAWSPDGSQLALAPFQGNASMWIADSAGGNQRQLTTEGLESGFQWSPDGKEIAYVSRRTGTGDIWVAPVAGGAPRQLTRDIREDNSPRWSPDGKWIAFISQRGRQTDLWVVPAGGGTEVRVTDDVAEEGNPQWVGTSEVLAYHTGITGQALWAISVDGKERRLTADSLRIAGPFPSPDGKEVVYQVLRGGGVSDLQVMPLAGGAARTLVQGTWFNGGPNWSPDGKFIVFQSDRSGNVDLWVVPAPGGEPKQLTDFSTDEFNPQWSRDGAFVYFTSTHDAAPFSDVWKVPVAGGPPIRITKAGTVNGLAVSLVSPDVFVQSVSGSAGQTVLGKVLPDGKIQTLWDKGNVTSISWLGLTPKGDSIAINAQLPGGGIGSYLLSTRTGQGHQVLGKDVQIGDFSFDGRWLAYWVGTATVNIHVIDMKDGSTRRLTNSPENENTYWWTADNKTIVSARQSQRRRIATVDLTKLFAAGK